MRPPDFRRCASVRRPPRRPPQALLDHDRGGGGCAGRLPFAPLRADALKLQENLHLLFRLHSHRSSDILMDSLVGSIYRVFNTNAVTPQALCGHATLHLLLWTDGSQLGRRPVTAAKIRILDPDRHFFGSGFSPVVNFMECFVSESKIPTHVREALLVELNSVYEERFNFRMSSARFKCLVFVADHKQLCILSGAKDHAILRICLLHLSMPLKNCHFPMRGITRLQNSNPCVQYAVPTNWGFVSHRCAGVQGGSTQQRCSMCTRAARHFRATMFNSCPRMWDSTASDATVCAAAIMRGDDTTAALRRKFDNVADIPLPMIGSCSWPLSDVMCCPPVHL